MIYPLRVFIGLGNEIKNSSSNVFLKQKGYIGRDYVDYLNRKYEFGEWIYSSNINCFFCEKDKILLIKPIASIFEKNGIIIKNILTYFDLNLNLNSSNLSNICIVYPDFYRPLGKYKYKKNAFIHKQLKNCFYNILNFDIISTIKCSKYLRLCLGTNNELKYVKPVHPAYSIQSIELNFLEDINTNEKHTLYKTFELADEYFNKQILHSRFITTDKIPFKKKYAAMEPQKNFKKDTSTRRYILDIYKHMYK